MSLPDPPQLVVTQPHVGAESHPVQQAMRVVFDNFSQISTSIDGLIAGLPTEIRSEITNALNKFVQQNVANGKSPTGATVWVIADTHVSRINLYTSKNTVQGTLFWETDRKVLYIWDNSTGIAGWKYVAGMMQGTFAQRPADIGKLDVGFLFYADQDSPSYNTAWRWTGTAWQVQYSNMRGTLSPNQKPVGLGAGDTNFLFYSTDFDHTYRWTGAAWQYINGDRSGYIAMFTEAPDPSTGWHICDGSTVARSKSDGSTANVTLPDLTSGATKFSYFKTNSAYSGVLAPAVAPGFTGGSFTPAGTVASTFTGSAMGTHQHELPLQIPNNTTTRFISAATFGTGTSRAAISKVAMTADTTNAAVTMSQAVSAGTPAGTVASTFTGTPAAVSGTIDNTGEPQHLDVIPYYRL